MEPFVVCNIKFHVKLGHPITVPEKLNDATVRHSNFVVIRVHPLVITVFPSSGHINVSGVRKFRDIKDAVRQLNQHLHCDIEERNITVDNSTASGKLQVQLPFNFNSLLKVEGKNLFNISVRPHFFPSIVLRPKVKKSLGTCMVFSTGTFIIVGAKSEEGLKDTYIGLMDMVKSI